MIQPSSSLIYICYNVHAVWFTVHSSYLYPNGKYLYCKDHPYYALQTVPLYPQLTADAATQFAGFSPDTLIRKMVVLLENKH